MGNHSAKCRDSEGYLDRRDHRSRDLRADHPVREREGENLVSVKRAERRVFGIKKVGLLTNCRSGRLSFLPENFTVFRRRLVECNLTMKCCLRSSR